MRLFFIFLALFSTLQFFGQEEECLAKFNFSTDSVFENVQFTFEDLSSYDSSANTHWLWSFESGNPSSSSNPNPVVIFPDSGKFEVCLTLTENNCSSTICDTIEVKDYRDTCYAEFDYYCDGSTHVNFYNQSSNLSATTYWTFGDGYQSNDNNPIHIYSENGFYDVCLSIESATCSDTICHSIYVGEPTGCQAFFNMDPGFWPNTYDFEDLSMGDVVLWYWDFGDGSFSVSSGLVRHTYIDSGLFQVCLQVLTADGCESSYCSSIYVSTPMGGDCYANFSVNEEYCANCYSFEDMSDISTELWYWDFGDGETLLGVANPIHTFRDSGWYNTCLTIYTSDNCVASFCDSIYVSESLSDSTLSLSGHVFAGTSLLPQGMAVLYQRQSDGKYLAINKSPITNGLYYFEVETSGNYLVQAIPYFEADYYYPVYFPSYYGNEIFWSEATVLNVSEPDLNYVNINLVQSNTLIYGKGETNGVLDIGDDAVFEDSIFGVNWFETNSIIYKDSLLPASNITIFLLDTNLMPLRFIITDVNGLFNFSKLSYCEFIIYPEKAGLETHPALISLNEEQIEPVFTHFTIRAEDIYFEPTGIISIKNLLLNLFPNPVNEWLNIQFQDFVNSHVEVSIMNSEGKKVFTNSYTSTNQSLIQVPVSGLSKGLYFVSLLVDNEYRILRKFVK